MDTDDVDDGAGHGADDGASFIDFGDGLGVLSREAFQLHGFAALNSIQDGHPGFVSDDYLNAISADSTTAAAELVAAGCWKRREGGYFIVADDVVKVAIDARERWDRAAQECQAAGRHVPAGNPKAAWVMCAHCEATLKRPDGGPVAAPDGGPPGPDPRTS